MILRRQIIFFPILGGRAPGSPPGSAPDIVCILKLAYVHCILLRNVHKHEAESPLYRIDLEPFMMRIAYTQIFVFFLFEKVAKDSHFHPNRPAPRDDNSSTTGECI